jgi:hypothetical protein
MPDHSRFAKMIFPLNGNNRAGISLGAASARHARTRNDLLIHVVGGQIVTTADRARTPVSSLSRERRRSLLHGISPVETV